MRSSEIRPGGVPSKVITRVVKKIAVPIAVRRDASTVRKQAHSVSRFEPIFILGPPRCGSTILYQALTNYFDVLYIDNLASRWAPALVTGLDRSMRRFGREPHNNFEGDLGSTLSSGGWHAPSECGGLWYQWIPFDQHYVAPAEVSQSMVEELRDAFTVVQNRWDRPLLIKNLHVGQRLAWITRSFPGARFICIHRDAKEVVDSILTARRRLEVPSDELWSTRPSEWSDLSGYPERDMVAAQVSRLTAQIEDDLEPLPRQSVRHVHYAEFSGALVKELGAWLGVEPRSRGSLPRFGVRA